MIFWDRKAEEVHPLDRKLCLSVVGSGDLAPRLFLSFFLFLFFFLSLSFFLSFFFPFFLWSSWWAVPAHSLQLWWHTNTISFSKNLLSMLTWPTTSLFDRITRDFYYASSNVTEAVDEQFQHTPQSQWHLNTFFIQWLFFLCFSLPENHFLTAYQEFASR